MRWTKLASKASHSYVKSQNFRLYKNVFGKFIMDCYFTAVLYWVYFMNFVIVIGYFFIFVTVGLIVFVLHNIANYVILQKVIAAVYTSAVMYL